MHRYYCFGPVGNQSLNLTGVDIHRVGIDICQDRMSTGVDDCMDRGAECQGCGDHFVTRTNPGGQQAQLQAGAAGPHSGGVVGAFVVGEVFFEARNFRSRAYPARAQALDDFVDLLLENFRLAEDKEILFFSDMRTSSFDIGNRFAAARVQASTSRSEQCLAGSTPVI